MQLSVIQIGNSKGLRLSKTILERYQIKDKVEMILEDDQIVLRPVAQVREGWAEAFKQMHERQEDELLIDDVFPDENLED
jgi:antitoxin MazE